MNKTEQRVTPRDAVHNEIHNKGAHPLLCSTQAKNKMATLEENIKLIIVNMFCVLQSYKALRLAGLQT